MNFRNYFKYAGCVLIIISGIACSSRQKSELVLGKVNSSELLSVLSNHRENVVLLNMWATWCDPCVKEFPDIVALHEKYRDKGLTVISVSHDFEEALADSFLTANEVEFSQNFIFDNSQDSDEFIRAIDDDWLGALPATWIFDRGGKRVYFVQEMFDTEILEAKILEVLEK